MGTGAIIVTLVVAILGSNGLATIVSILINRHYQKKDKKIQDLEIMQDAIKAISHDSYFRHCRYLLGKKEITESELENHTYLYNAYHAQGLNDIGDKMHDQIMDMPVVPDKVEWNS